MLQLVGIRACARAIMFSMPLEIFLLDVITCSCLIVYLVSWIYKLNKTRG